MIKVVYASLVFILSSAIVFLSKGKSHQGKCAMEITGVVSSRGDSTTTELIIVSKDNKRYLPKISNEEVVLVLGQQVKACATPLGTTVDSMPIVAIHQIAVLP